MKAYFIGGLGCNCYYPQDFFNALSFPVTYLDIYDSRLEEQLISLQALKDWFMAQVDMDDDILLIAHSLGADLAVYLTSVYDKITHLVLLDGGYINMDKICPLNVEIEDSLNYLQTNVYESLKKAAITEKQSSAVWSENLERAAKDSFVFYKVKKHWYLSLSEKLMTHLLTIRRQDFRNLSFLKNKNVILFIPEINNETPIWKKRAIQTIPNFLNLIEMTSCSHSLYMEKPKEVAVLLEDKMKIRSLF